jgi:ABC-type transport system involved in cytochrome bd biosynthesis fused ATPase/permease subunit
MSQLINEILLRFVKPLLAAVIGLVAYAVAVGWLHVTPSFELAAVCWVSGAVLILLMETSPL